MAYKIAFIGKNAPYGGDCFKRYKAARAHLKSLGFVPEYLIDANKPGVVYPHEFVSLDGQVKALIHSIR